MIKQILAQDTSIMLAHNGIVGAFRIGWVVRKHKELVVKVCHSMCTQPARRQAIPFHLLASFLRGALVRIPVTLSLDDFLIYTRKAG